jgi:23S rRNA maturation mini-RNase III
MKQFTLKAGEIVKINGIPIALVDDAIFETHESNMSVIFPTQNKQDKGHEQSSSNKP